MDESNDNPEAYASKDQALSASQDTNINKDSIVTIDALERETSDHIGLNNQTAGSNINENNDSNDNKDNNEAEMMELTINYNDNVNATHVDATTAKLDNKNNEELENTKDSNDDIDDGDDAGSIKSSSIEKTRVVSLPKDIFGAYLAMRYHDLWQTEFDAKDQICYVCIMILTVIVQGTLLIVLTYDACSADITYDLDDPYKITFDNSFADVTFSYQNIVNKKEYSFADYFNDTIVNNNSMYYLYNDSYYNFSMGNGSDANINIYNVTSIVSNTENGDLKINDAILADLEPLMVLNVKTIIMKICAFIVLYIYVVKITFDVLVFVFDREFRKHYINTGCLSRKEYVMITGYYYYSSVFLTVVAVILVGSSASGQEAVLNSVAIMMILELDDWIYIIVKKFDIGLQDHHLQIQCQDIDSKTKRAYTKTALFIGFTAIVLGLMCALQLTQGTTYTQSE